MNLVGDCNAVLEVVEIGKNPPEDNVSYLGFGLRNAISFWGNENVLKFKNFFSDFYHSDKDIFNNVSEKKVTDALVRLFKEKKMNGGKISIAEIDAIKNLLKSNPVSTYRVLRGIYGIDLQDLSKPYHIGNFTIYHYSSHKNIIESYTPVSPEFLLMDKEEYLVEYKVEARDGNKALEKADKYFALFPLFVKFMLGSKIKHHDIGILQFPNSTLTQAFILSAEDNSIKLDNENGFYLPFHIDDEYFIKPEAGYDKLWILIDKANKNKLETRIVNAVQWIGKSLSESDFQSAFIQTVIAIEIIFTFQEKTVVTPSIMSQISESLALIVGNNYAERIEIEKRIKDLYGVRSGIVHAGKDEISYDDYMTFLQYARIVIIRLLTDKELIRLDSIEKLFEYTKKLKYS